MNRRGSGVLLHISSLPSPYGVGDMGPEAYRFADFLADSKQMYWQILPLNPTSTAYGNSPYSSPSTFAGNTLFISPDLLEKEGFIGSDDISRIEKVDTSYVDYEAATTIKDNLLGVAYDNFNKARNDETYYDFQRFCDDSANWLEDYAMFMSLREEFGYKAWSEWPGELRDREPEALREAGKRFEDTINRRKFFQYLFYRQWFRLKNYCNERNIQIIGDLPIYPNYDSSDVWTNQSLFKLNDQRKPRFSAGVPPDYFSSTGQLWGNPVYDWDNIRDAGYKWWIDRFEHNLGITDIVRVDHFRGFVAYWEVPSGHKTAMKGKWVDVPVDDFFNTMNRHFTSLPVIAEDLGTITPDVREVMERFDIPGMKVLLFAFGDDFPNGSYLPHTYSPDCVVYTGTHDNNTVKGWFRKEADEDQKNRLSKYLGFEVTRESISWALIRLAMSSVAKTAIIPMQDILGLDEKSMMNLPSTSAGNWRWKLDQAYIDNDSGQKLGEVTEIFGRS